MDRREQAQWLAREVLPHEADVRRWLAARVRGLSGLELDDAIQESYARLCTVDPARVLDARGYFFVTARHVVGEVLRRSRIVSIETVADIESLNIVDGEASPERQVSGREELARLRQALTKLPAKCRRAFELRKFEELSQRQIAQRMGIAESTVEKHLSKALRLVMLEMNRIERGSSPEAVKIDGRRRTTK
jgi:RNA polymerase sigma-70 factor (ECF subfamily)